MPKVPGIHTDGWLPVPGSSNAHLIDRGWNWAMVVATVVFFTVIIPMFYFMWKYKRRSENDKTIEVDHSTKLEIGWSLIPTIVVMALFFVGLKGYVAASVPPRGAYEIRVQAQKWSWTFIYPDFTSAQLVVPKGQPVKLVMSSTDVLHSLYIPEFRVKNDAIPGNYTTVWFEATRAGETTLECTEFCGKDHSNMLTTVRVLEPAEWQAWYSSQSTTEATPEAGKKLYEERGCIACHTLDGTVRPGGGPTFKGLYGKTETMQDGSTVVVDDNYIHESILNPTAKIVKDFQPIMPPFAGVLKDDQITAIIMFIKEQK